MEKGGKMLCEPAPALPFRTHSMEASRYTFLCSESTCSNAPVQPMTSHMRVLKWSEKWFSLNLLGVPRIKSRQVNTDVHTDARPEAAKWSSAVVLYITFFFLFTSWILEICVSKTTKHSLYIILLLSSDLESLRINDFIFTKIQLRYGVAWKWFSG